jgi:hypothetical protein
MSVKRERAAVPANGRHTMTGVAISAQLETF